MNNGESMKSKFSDVLMDKTNLLSDYVQHNLLGFQNLRNRDYKTAILTFEKCIEISKEIDEIKQIESLTNYSICLYFNGRFIDSYNFLEKAKDISYKFVETNFNERSIQKY
jgi:tetratricopeptide (TPR) repeat protein